MKRPDGFDPRTPEASVPPTRGAEARRTPGTGKKPAQQKPARQKAAEQNRKPAPNQGEREPRKPRAGADTPRTRKLPADRHGRAPRDPEPGSSRPAGAQARKASRIRRRYERSEVRRFTRRSRHRRLAWLASAAAIVVLCGLVAIAVYSPLLALKTLKIEGASRVSAADIRTSLKNQLGTPLALVDFGQIKKDLAKFPLIRSYVTETVPPNTLIVHIVERSPIGVLETPSDYIVVDAAGVTISHSTERPEKLPIIDSGSLKSDSTAFRAAVAVLLALPASVATRVEMVTARTNDDVTLVLDGVGQRVVWGSADRSAVKGRVLADLIAQQDPGVVVEYDVSAPNNAVIRTG